MSDFAPILDQVQRLGLALAIGFLVGVERGWKQRTEHEGERVAGLRTFALAGLLGGVSGLLAPLAAGLSTVLAIAFSAGFILFQFGRSPPGDSSATSTIAGILVFGLGAFATLGNPVLAAAAGVSVAAILAFKQGLHAWLNSLTWAEIRSAILILVATFIILPLTPSGPVDPWGLVDVRSLWIMTITIALAGFGGYIALRISGGAAGLIAGALIGGLVSSTSVTLDLARRVQASQMDAASGAAGASVAALTSLVRVATITGVLSAGLLADIWAPLATAGAVLAAGAVVLMRVARRNGASYTFETVRSPMDLVSVARFAAILGALTIAANLMSRSFGHAGLHAFAATAGLVDVDAVVLSLGGLLSRDLPLSQAGEAVGLALISNQVFKIVVTVFAGSLALAWRLMLVTGLAVLAAIAVFLI